MNARERWLQTLLFGKPEKVPLLPGAGRRSTLRRWRQEGLPDDIRDPAEYAYRLAGGKDPWDQFGEEFRVNERMIPQFEEKVLEERERSIIVQDWKGNICEISNEYTPEYLRDPIDFVTRRWIRCPVQNEQDWEKMKQRYNPNDPARLPEDAAEKASRLQNRTWPLGFILSGPFWQLREWLGFENLCMLFYDNITLVQEMIQFWDHFISQLLTNAFRYIVPDYVRINEDMAFKGFSMISPAMVRRYLLPTWKRWGEIIRAAGCPVYAVDSDGFIEELIPIWMEAGIHVCEPMEVAAGCDVVKFRTRFGRNMAYIGGVDKRKIAQGGEVIKQEIDSLLPVIKEGGYIPGCDHGVPADVSWDHYVYYVKLLAEATGWL